VSLLFVRHSRLGYVNMTPYNPVLKVLALEGYRAGSFRVALWGSRYPRPPVEVLVIYRHNEINDFPRFRQ